MTKDKLNLLIKYLAHLQARQEAPTPAKHDEKAFRAYLAKEIAVVKSKIEAGRLELGGK